jgi:hypothetical protein
VHLKKVAEADKRVYHFDISGWLGFFDSFEFILPCFIPSGESVKPG